MAADRIHCLHTRIEAETLESAWAQMIADIPPEGKASSFTLTARDLPGVWDITFGSKRIKCLALNA